MLSIFKKQQNCLWTLKKQVVKQYKFVIEPTVLFCLYYVEFYTHVCVRAYVCTSAYMCTYAYMCTHAYTRKGLVFHLRI